MSDDLRTPLSGSAFYLEPEHWPASDGPIFVTVQGQEARHMLGVLRHKPGDLVQLFDGRGRRGLFRIETAGKNSARLRSESVETLTRPVRQCVLAQGWSKSLRRGWLMEKAVEFEASGLWLWQGRHSQGRVPEEGKESWLQQCVAGAKQSKNPWLPELATLPRGARQLAQALPRFQRSFLLWERPKEQNVLSLEALTDCHRVLFIVGPEGGLHDEEVATLLEAGAEPMSLGQRVLRWETAALLCLGLFWWAGQQSAASKETA